MKDSLKWLARCAREVAEKADAAQDAKPTSMDALHQAMMNYRSAAVGYIAHPSVGDFIKADALRYEGETREAVERIAELIDRLNDLR